MVKLTPDQRITKQRLRSKGEDGAGHVLREELRSLPIDLRAEFIIEVLSVVVSEFAVMVLEHVKPSKRKTLAKRHARMVKGIRR
jgi:hypothetical protein